MTDKSYLPITIVPYKTFHERKNTIYMSPALLDYFSLTNNEYIQIYIGAKILKTVVVSMDTKKDEVYFNEELFSTLLLPDTHIRFLAQFDAANRQLYIGPIITIVTEINERVQSFQSIQYFCEELQRLTAEFGGFFYVFTLKDFSMESIEGYYYFDEQWVKSTLPHPNVIYNRVHSRKIEGSPYYQKKMEEIAQLSIPIFNPGFLPKWTVHELLILQESLQLYIPETMPLTKDNLQILLSKYDSVYIKPNEGSQGRNISFAQLINDKVIIHSHSDSSSEKTREITSEAGLINWCKDKVSYIVQQAIPLVQFNGRKLDFRILCHKTSTEQWKVTSIIARVAAEGYFVSNIAQGGELIDPLQLLAELYVEKTARKHIASMKDICLQIASVISENSVGLVGELGIDIGIDEEGQLWIIEVNSKPSKHVREATQKIRPSARAIYDYCTALSFKHFKIT